MASFLKWQADKIENCPNVKLTKWSVDERASLLLCQLVISSTGKLTKCEVDKMRSWQNAKLTKCQVDKMPSWQNAKLTKCQVDKCKFVEMASWQNSKLTKMSRL
jgi:hypothetical protein